MTSSPITLANVQGVVQMHDGQWTSVKELVATCGPGTARLWGTLNCSPADDVLDLGITAKNVALNEELRGACRPASRNSGARCSRTARST